MVILLAEMCVVVVERWCWVLFSAGTSYHLDKSRARAYFACSRPSVGFFDIVLFHIISLCIPPLSYSPAAEVNKLTSAVKLAFH